jgi:hypothetical protein
LRRNNVQMWQIAVLIRHYCGKRKNVDLLRWEL